MNIYKCDYCGKIFDDEDHTDNYDGMCCKIINVNVNKSFSEDDYYYEKHLCAECDEKFYALKNAIRDGRVKMTKKGNLKIKKKKVK